MGRPTEENKSETVRVRIPYRLMRYLKKRVISRDCTISDYIRELIEADMDKNGQK